jgi:hypothetical protein
VHALHRSAGITWHGSQILKLLTKNDRERSKMIVAPGPDSRPSPHRVVGVDVWRLVQVLPAGLGSRVAAGLGLNVGGHQLAGIPVTSAPKVAGQGQSLPTEGIPALHV